MGPHNLNNTFHSEIVNQIPFTVAACPKKNLMSILVEPWYLHTVTFLFKDKSICFQYKQRVPLGGRLVSEGNNTAVESRSWMEFFSEGETEAGFANSTTSITAPKLIRHVKVKEYITHEFTVLQRILRPVTEGVTVSLCSNWMHEAFSMLPVCCSHR